MSSPTHRESAASEEAAAILPTPSPSPSPPPTTSDSSDEPPNATGSTEASKDRKPGSSRRPSQPKEDATVPVGSEKALASAPSTSHLLKLLADTPPKFARLDTPSDEDHPSALSSPGGIPRSAILEPFSAIASPLSAPFVYNAQDTPSQARGRPATISKRGSAQGQKGKPPTVRTLSSPPSIKRMRSTPRTIQIPQQPFALMPPVAQGQPEERRLSMSRARSPLLPSPSKELGAAFAPQDREPKTDEGSRSAKEHPGRLHERHPSFPALPLNTYLSLALSSPAAPGTPFGDVPPQNFSYPSTDPADLVIERLINFVNLPRYLEGCMFFATLACLDNWLWCFTILPLRFLRALVILADYWWSSFTGWFHGGKRLAKKNRNGAVTPVSGGSEKHSGQQRRTSERSSAIRISDGGERGKRVVSKLQPAHKAEILRGLLVFCSCWLLMRMDASKLYHTIRGQAAIKLYVIYNVLEMADRLLAALGQDILECLFCRDTLERKENGRSKVLRPFLCFVLALIYNVSHTGILFYQLVTLNVAVNSYSNALLTLLMSTQFVEIKATVFKKFEKESLFQMTCADIVERFQLWLMLLIILMRNLVEMSARSTASDPLGGLGSAPGSPSSFAGTVWPKSFTFVGGEAGKLFGPFVMVIGSEMIVDWIKHAFINKFNVIRPQTYGKYLDVLCKDYYSNAFGDQNLHKRLGLPVIPLSCLFIRVCFQTFQQFLAIVPLTPPSRASDASNAIATRIRGLNGTITSVPQPTTPNFLLTIQSIFEPLLTQTTIPLIISSIALFFIFLALKLALGILLLNFARKRYKGMKERERESAYTSGNPVGGFGVVEVDEKKRKDLYEPGEKIPPKKRPGERDLDLSKVERFKMVAKRIY